MFGISNLHILFYLPTDSAREAWISAKDSLDRLQISAGEHKIFFNEAAFFEEGEKTGHLLAKMSKSQQVSLAIGAIRSKSGLLTPLN